MKKVFFILFLFLTQLVFSQDWKTNFEEAKKIAMNENKKIVLVFSGSDWCAPCIKLENNIWKSDYFVSYSKENLILVKADFPKKKVNALPAELKASNSILADKYNKEGFFPLVVLLDSSGKVINKKGYENCSPEEYIKQLIISN
jgi:thioredoxin-related protein